MQTNSTNYISKYGFNKLPKAAVFSHRMRVRPYLHYKLFDLGKGGSVLRKVFVAIRVHNRFAWAVFCELLTTRLSVCIVICTTVDSEVTGFVNNCWWCWSDKLTNVKQTVDLLPAFESVPVKGAVQNALQRCTTPIVSGLTKAVGSWILALYM